MFFSFYPNSHYHYKYNNHTFLKVEYGVGISLLGDKQYGTIENTNSGLPAKIVNVDDAAKALLEYITKDKMSNNAFYMSKVKLGDLHVYDDGRPMRFIKV